MLKSQQADYVVAVSAYNETLLTAVQQVADSLIEWRQSLGNITIQEQALQTANAESKLSDIRYKAGLSSLDGVIEADASLISQCWKMS